MLQNLKKTILKIKTKNQLKNTFFQFFQNKRDNSKLIEHRSNVNILILNAPCNGFGDLIFAMKIGKYMKEWYNAKVIIATPLYKELANLGEKEENIVPLKSGKEKTLPLVAKRSLTANNCRRFKSLVFGKNVPIQDLIFIAPIQQDFDPSLRDVKYLIPYATNFNTFTFSEYNDRLYKRLDFNTGIGKGRDGLLLTDVKNIRGEPQKVNKPYAMAYIASPDNIPLANKCLFAFMEMICDKYSRREYSKTKKFEIVVPSWIQKEKSYFDKQLRLLSSYFSRVIVKYIDKEEVIFE